MPCPLKHCETVCVVMFDSISISVHLVDHLVVQVQPVPPLCSAHVALVPVTKSIVIPQKLGHAIYFALKWSVKLC